MATHSSILAWRIPWTEEPATIVGCNKPRGHKELDINEQRTFSLSQTYCTPLSTPPPTRHSTLNGLSENRAPKKFPVLCFWGPLEANALFLRICSFLLSPAASAFPSCCQKHMIEPSQASPAPLPPHLSQPLPLATSQRSWVLLYGHSHLEVP